MKLYKSVYFCLSKCNREGVYCQLAKIWPISHFGQIVEDSPTLRFGLRIKRNAAKQRRQHARIHPRSSSTKGHFPTNTSSTEGCLPLKVIFPLKVITSELLSLEPTANSHTAPFSIDGFLLIHLLLYTLHNTHLI